MISGIPWKEGDPSGDRVLYISYDGMLEPLGQSQVCAYLRRLAPGRVIHLLSFEKPEDLQDQEAFAAVASDLRSAGIVWHPLKYHRRPSALATAWDIAVGWMLGMLLIWRHGIGIVHARSYVPAVIALCLKALSGTTFLFDMRGYWADERVDGGLWPRHSTLYRVAKWFERRFLLAADHVVSLTHMAARDISDFPYLQGRVPPITVIPTCADMERFSPEHFRAPEFDLGYVGSAGTWYEFDATVACFAEVRRIMPGARFLIVNRGEHDWIRSKLVQGGVSLEGVELKSAAHHEMPGEIRRMQAAVFFVKPLYSKRASAPTKLGELLACGVPCLSNQGVGDMAEILEVDKVGVAVESFSQASLAGGVERLIALLKDPEVRERCRGAATRHFSLQTGVQQYAAIYRSLAKPNARQASAA
jgi:glycosyltransferase involved in cell wall biosynthesis